MPTGPVDRLLHIKAAIKAAHNGVGGLNADVVADLPFLAGGLSYQLLVITEASRNIPAEWKQTFGPAIDWRALEDLGNHLRHAYHRVDIAALWAIYEHDLDPLEAAIDRMIAVHGATRGRSPSS
jgi:uncharacterized protein with HEPN domain